MNLIFLKRSLHRALSCFIICNLNFFRIMSTFFFVWILFASFKLFMLRRCFIARNLLHLISDSKTFSREFLWSFNFSFTTKKLIKFPFNLMSFLNYFYINLQSKTYKIRFECIVGHAIRDRRTLLINECLFM